MNGPDAAKEGDADGPTEYRRRIKSRAFFRERDFAAAFTVAIPAGFAPPRISEMPGKTASLSSFGTEGPKTDAENPQVNR
jgi:hypothetical protein